ncbi:MAG: hypothetical protein QOH51_3102 [Acidobacteriota bacterium]|nr:hypothetical protein [Acidobacteriota bacterium]
MGDAKPKTASSLRTPGPKKRLGLIVPPALRLPHDDLIRSETGRDETSMTSQTSHTSQPPDATDRPSQETAPVAPVRDYTKVANSIVREAVPAGVFNGKSKQLYDCLYQQTRGAVVPSRTIRISRPKLMKKARIGARVTFDANVERLVEAGLIEVRTITGEHEGNEYTVYLPEEVTIPSLTSLTSLTRYAQKLDRLVRLETSQTRHSLIVENTDTSPMPKTSFKTNTEKIDDEAFAALNAKLRQAVKDITGKEPSVTEDQRWAEVAELLVTELKIAAGRTNVSSVPAFLAEHLRRRLFKKDQKQLLKEEAEIRSASAALKVDAAQCQECFGTGMWYPEGFEKGVAKCQHKRLSEISEAK